MTPNTCNVKKVKYTPAIQHNIECNKNNNTVDELHVQQNQNISQVKQAQVMAVQHCPPPAPTTHRLLLICKYVNCSGSH